MIAAETLQKSEASDILRLNTDRTAVREAAHTLPGCETTPLEALINNCVEQLAHEYEELVGEDLAGIELIRASVRRGLELGAARIADLL